MIRVYLAASGLLVLGYGLLWLVAKYRGAGWSASLKLRLAHGIFAAAFLLPVMAEWLPSDALPRASVQVWSGKPRGNEGAPYRMLTASVSPNARPVGLTLEERWLKLSAGIALAILMAMLSRHAWRLWTLRRALQGTTEIRRIGRVSIRVMDDSGREVGASPYSAWGPGGAYVVLPLGLLEHRGDFSIAVKHELQHHRQGDPLWVHIFEFCKALFFWNPALYGWARLLESLQELACDEALIGRQGLSPQAYGSCLLRAAQRAVGARPTLLAGTAGMATGRSGLLLKRRIEMLFEANQFRKKGSGFLAAIFALGTLVLMGSTAYAARGLVRDRALTMVEARRLAVRTPQGGIPVELNERVLEQLNRTIGTPEGRARVKDGFARMPLYRAMIERKLTAAGYPLDLLAVPMAESGYRNDVSSPGMKARGLWQFIEQTALNYGLEITDRVDQRLDPERETDAAIAYYHDLMAEFGDWRLALKGYNEGESRVRRLIEQHHTRDPWELERFSSPENYLPKVVAMILIMRNPTLLD